MSDYGFTPGKWEADDIRYQRDLRTFVNVGSADALVACVSSDPQHPEAIAANARLIAASPTLLEALQNALAVGLPEIVAAEARAAIALATGKGA